MYEQYVKRFLDFFSYLIGRASMICVNIMPCIYLRCICMYQFVAAIYVVTCVLLLIREIRFLMV
jgi:hypothetical protein